MIREINVLFGQTLSFRMIPAVMSAAVHNARPLIVWIPGHGFRESGRGSSP